MEADDLTGAEIATNHADAAIVSDDQINNRFFKLKSNAVIRYFYRRKKGLGNKSDLIHYLFYAEK